MSAAGSSDGSAARGRWLVFAATVCWGTTATLARFVFRDRHVPPLEVVELRLLIAATILVPWLAWRRSTVLRIARADWGYFITLGLFGVAAVQGSYYTAISGLGVGLAILLQYLAPTLIVLFDLVRGRRVSGRLWIAAACGVAGTALLVGGVDERARHAHPIYWAVGFLSAFIFAFYIVYSKRGLEKYAPETVLAYTFTIAALFWAFFAPPWRIVSAGYGRDLWLLFLVLGVFSTLVPFSLFYAGLRRLRPAETGIVATLEPLVAVVSAWLFLGEGLRWIQWVGAAAVLGAALLASGDRPEASAARTEVG